jgi:hypothetical protein
MEPTQAEITSWLQDLRQAHQQLWNAYQNVSARVTQGVGLGVIATSGTPPYPLTDAQVVAANIPLQTAAAVVATLTSFEGIESSVNTVPSGGTVTPLQLIEQWI